MITSKWRNRFDNYATNNLYIICHSFVLGYIFQTNGVDTGGGIINNLWLIWTITIFVFIFIAIIIELFVLKKTNR